MLLRDPEFTDAHRPEFVIRVGELPTSKPLRSWLASLDDVVQIADRSRRRLAGPGRHGGHADHRPVQRAAQDDAAGAPPAVVADPGWLESWRAADETVAQSLSATLGDQLSEPLVAARLTEWLPPEATLFVASSMPIRDVETARPGVGAEPEDPVQPGRQRDRRHRLGRVRRCRGERRGRSCC